MQGLTPVTASDHNYVHIAGQREKYGNLPSVVAEIREPFVARMVLEIVSLLHPLPIFEVAMHVKADPLFDSNERRFYLMSRVESNQ